MVKNKYFTANKLIASMAMVMFGACSQASTWIPIQSGKQRLLLPNPKLESALLNNVLTENAAVKIQTGPMIEQENLYHRRQTLVNGSWQNDAWQCQSGSEITQAGNSFVISNIPVGVHRYEMASCMAQSSCSTGYDSASAVCSSSITTDSFLAVNTDAALPTIASQNREIHLTWSPIADADEYRVEIFKNGVWQSLSVLNSAIGTITPASYQAQFAQNGYFNAGILGNGYFDVRVSYCYQNNCTTPVASDQQLAVAPSNMTAVKSYNSPQYLPDGEFRVISYGSMPGRFIIDVYPPDSEISYYKITRVRQATGNIGEEYFEPGTQSFIVTTDDALKHQLPNGPMYEFNHYSTEKDARYSFTVNACYGEQSQNLCSNSHHTTQFFHTNIQSNPTITGQLDSYVLGSKAITGRAEFSSSAMGRSVRLETKSGQLLSQKALYTQNNDFTFANLDTIPELNPSQLPVDLVVTANSSTLGRDYILGRFTLSRYDNPEMIAVADDIEVPRAKTSTLNLLSNDTFDSDPLSVVIVEQPFAGNVSSTGSWVKYTPPNSYFEGDLTFKYKLLDAPIGQASSGKSSNIVTVNLSVQGDNEPPQAVDDIATVQVVIDPANPGVQAASQSRFKKNGEQNSLQASSSSVNIDVLGNDSDADGNSSMFIVANSLNPKYGDVNVVNDGKTLVYTPAINQTQDDDFTYGVSDGKGGYSQANVNVRIDLSFLEYTPNIDPRGKNVVISRDFNSRIFTLVQYRKASDAWLWGQWVALGNNKASETLRLEPGDYEFRSASCQHVDLLADDLDCDDYGAPVDVEIVNALPVAVYDEFTVSQYENTFLPVLSNDSDLDDALTVTAVNCLNVSNCPFSLDAQNRVAYSSAAPGQYQFEYTLTDASNATSTATVDVTVTESAPISVVDVKNLDVTTGSFTIDWVAKANATSYKLFEEFNGSEGSAISDITTTQMSFANKPAGRYRYSIALCNGNSCSEKQTSAAFTIPQPSETTGTAARAVLTGLSGDVGVTAGNFRVSESGAATYSLPLSLPAGVAGVKPPVSLEYNSQGGDGLLGRGWSLNAGGAIVRCARNITHNGEIDSVTYDSSDLFCLNGQQLQAKSGDYGADGTTYYSRLDNFDIITSHTTSGVTGPAYFTVETKSGDTYYYGKVDGYDDALVEPNIVGGDNNQGKYWALKKVVDVSQNAIVYHYDENKEAGTHTLARVEYGGNEGVAASRHFNQVVFNYRDNPKPSIGYSAGSFMAMDKLLDSVSITVDGSSYRYYDVNYFASEVIEERNYLETITECLVGPVGESSASNCLSPLSFTWERPTAVSTAMQTVTDCEPSQNGEQFCETYQTPVSTNFTPFTATIDLNSHSSGRKYARMFDINADGYSDIVYEDDGWKALLGPNIGDTPVSLTTIGSHDDDRGYLLTIDYDGDGKQELLVGNSNGDNANSNWYVVSYKDSNLVVKNIGVTAIGVGQEAGAQVVDVDGDGLQDIVFKYNRQISMYHNQTTTTGTPVFSNMITLTNLSDSESDNGYGFNTNHYHSSASMKNAASIDINGDGRSDVLSRVTTISGYCEIEGHGEGTDTKGDCEEFGGTWQSSSSSNWRLFVSSGDLDSPQMQQKQTIGYKGLALRVADLNGDGLTDIVYRKDEDDRWYYRLSNGRAFGEEHSTGHVSPVDAAGDIMFIDLNKDGRADILKPTSKTNWDILISRPSAESNVVFWQKRGTLARTEDASLLAGDVDGDGKMDLVTAANDNGWKVQYDARKGIIDNVITDIDNGWGVSTTIHYGNMLKDNVEIDVTLNDIDDTLAPVGPMTVVRSVESDVDTNGNRVSVDYRYGGMLLHRKGLGSLGYQVLETKDAQTNVKTTTTYSQSYPYVGMPVSTEQVASDGLRLSSSSNVFGKIDTTSNGGTFVFIDVANDTQYQIDSNNVEHKLATTVTNNDYGNWGNLTGSSVKVYDGATLLHTTQTTNDFGASDSFEQKKGRLLTSSVTKTPANGNAITRNSSFTYYGASDSCEGYGQPEGMLESTTVNGLTTLSCYNAFGHNIKETKTAKLNDGDSQTTSISSTSAFSSDGRALSSTTNNLGHTTTYNYNSQAATGEVRGLITQSSVVGVNNIKALSHLDGWGNTLATEVLVDGIPTVAAKTTKTAYCSSCSKDSKYYVEVTQAGTPTTRVFYNKFGLEVASRVEHFNDGEFSYTFKDYDSQGRLLKEYLPSKSSVRTDSSSAYTKHNYDAFSRMNSTEYSNGGTSSVTLEGKVTTYIDAKNHTRKQTRNLLGELVSVEDALQGTLTYTYDAYGNLKTAKKSDGTTTITQLTNHYDNYGQKESMTDVDKGTWNYRFNGFGQPVWQQNGNNDTTTTEYDSSGRKVRQYAFDNTQCWIYGDSSATNAVGKLVETKYFDLAGDKSCSDSDFNQGSKIAYDSAGRAHHTTETIENLMNPLNGEYHSYLEHDEYGRLLKQRFAGLGLTIRHEYKNGYPYKLVNDDTGVVYQEITEMNAKGQTKTVKYGNQTQEIMEYYDASGLVKSHSLTKGATLHSLAYGYDLIGNLENRSHAFGAMSGNADYSESYVYDELNRLTDRTIALATQGSMPSAYTMNAAYRYDGFGNITRKDGTGYYKYDGNKRLKGVYSNTGHSGAPLYDFAYDSNGNITNDGNREMLYSSFDKPIWMNKGQTNTSFTYGMGHKRFYRHDKRQVEGNLVNTHTLYASGMEKIYRVKGDANPDLMEYKITVGNVVITERTNALNNSSTEESYLHKDHLGSPLTITGKDGAVIQQNVYDPWGKVHQLHLDNTYTSDKLVPTTRGFTGHEGIEGLDIIHMNGRIYDPSLGRFLQADPHIQAPKNSQNYNRYSYVLNNPLSMTDPSGYFFKWAAGKLLGKAGAQIAGFSGGLLGAAFGAWAYDRTMNSQGLQMIASVALNFIPGCAVWCSALFSAQVSYYQTGSLGAAFHAGGRTAAVAGVFMAIGSAFDGAKGSWNVQNGAAHVAAHAVAGGVISELQGGKFGHGFFSAGFSKFAMANAGFDWDDVSTEAIAQRTVIAALVGGTTSVISGGKFANGAVTAAMAHLFNAEASNYRQKTTVSLGYKKIGGIGGKSWNHAYVKVQGPNGEIYVIRGGPSSDAGSPLAVVLSESVGSGSSAEGSFGTLQIIDGAEAVRIESGPNSDMQNVLTTDESFDSIVDKLGQFGDSVNNANIPYLPLSTNSNAFAHQAVTVLGISRPTASVWSPGSQTELGVD